MKDETGDHVTLL